MIWILRAIVAAAAVAGFCLVARVGWILRDYSPASEMTAVRTERDGVRWRHARIFGAATALMAAAILAAPPGIVPGIAAVALTVGMLACVWGQVSTRRAEPALREVRRKRSLAFERLSPAMTSQNPEIAGRAMREYLDLAPEEAIPRAMVSAQCHREGDRIESLLHLAVALATDFSWWPRIRLARLLKQEGWDRDARMVYHTASELHEREWGRLGIRGSAQDWRTYEEP